MNKSYSPMYFWPNDSTYIIGKWRETMNVLLSHIPNNQDLHINANNWKFPITNEALIKAFQHTSTIPYDIIGDIVPYIWTKFDMPASSYFTDITYCECNYSRHCIMYKTLVARIHHNTHNDTFDIMYETKPHTFKLHLINTNNIDDANRYSFYIQEVK